MQTILDFHSDSDLRDKHDNKDMLTSSRRSTTSLMQRKHKLGSKSTPKVNSLTNMDAYTQLDEKITISKKNDAVRISDP